MKLPVHRAGLAGHLPVKIRWQSKKLQIQGAQILRNEAYLQYAAVTKDAAQRSPSALLRAVSPSTLLRTVSLSNGLSNGSWTFYEAIIIFNTERERERSRPFADTEISFFGPP